MNNTPEISVIIPTWNRADVIEKTVRSALNQTFDNIEVLICDDGSDDDTSEIINSIDDTRLIWLPGERAGRPAPPRNRGIKAARADWLAFLDSDDEWLPDKLEKQFKAAEHTGTQAVSTNAFRVIPGKNPPYEEFIYWNKSIITFFDLIVGNVVINSSAMVKKELVLKSGGFPEEEAMRAIEDYALWLRVATQTGFTFVNECLVNYLDEPAASVRTKNLGISDVKEKCFDNFRIWAAENNTDKKYIDALDNWKVYALKNPIGIGINAFKKIKRNFLGW